MKLIRIILIIVFVLCSTIHFAQTKTYYVATSGSDSAPYDTWTKAAGSIQTVISAASDGDIIIVGSSDGHGSGIYSENIVVNKQLTIQSENGYGTTTIEAADPKIHVIEITADNVTISGFSIYGGTDMWIDQSTGELHFPVGILLNNVNSCTIENNRSGWDGAHQNTLGISLYSSANCVISGNIASYNRGAGIGVDSSDDNTIISNTVIGNDADGLSVGFSTGNIISGNTVSNNGLDGFIIGDSKSNTFNNNVASGNGFHGFQVSSCTDNTLVGNRADSNHIQGFYLVSCSNNTLENNTAYSNRGVGIGLDMSTYIRVTGNTVKHNEYGVFIGGGSNNMINSNVMNDNDGRPDGDGIMLTGSSYNTIMNNTMNNDPGDGIEFHESSNNNVIGNTVINSGWGIRINMSSSNNVLSGNTVNDGVKGIILEEAHTINNVLANNTTNNNGEDGIFLFDYTSDNILIGNTARDNAAHGIHINGDSQGNTMYLNNLIDNKENSVFLDDSNNTWHSPAEINYDYNNGTIHKGYLGNYYSDGTHTGSNGIGGLYNLNDADSDDYQLIDTSGSYALEAWWLNDNGNMYIGDAGKAGGRAGLNSGGTDTWKAEQFAPGNITFFGNEPWTGEMVFSSAPAAGHSFVLEIGSVSGSNNFTSGGPDATLTGDGNSTRFTFATDTSTFTLPAGSYLGLRIKSGDTGDTLMTGGAWSFISSPESKMDSILPPPSMPELLSPESNENNLPFIVDLICSKTPRAVQYHWQVTADKNLNSFAVDDSTSDSSITVGPLSAGEKYYWRARSIGLTGCSDFTSPDSFTVKFIPVPELLSPNSNENNLPPFVELVCGKNQDIVQYHWQVTGDRNFNSLAVDDSTSDSTVTVGPLLKGSKYYWRVRGIGLTGVSDFTNPDSFTIKPSLLIPDLLSPESNALNLPPVIDLICSKIPEINIYNWQLSLDTDFSNFVVDDSTSDTTITVGPLSAGEKYYWRVRGITLTDSSDFAFPDSFTVISVPPPPELISPVSSIDEELLPAFIWHQSEFASEYHLQVTQDSLFTTMVFDSLLTDTTATLSDSLNLSTLYFWRVSGKNAAGEGLYSSEAHFRTTALVGIKDDNLPGEFALFQNYPNPFNPVTIIEYHVASDETVTLKVYDILGREVASLVNEQKKPGIYKVRLDGSRISSGVYFYRLRAGEFVQTKRFLLIK